MKHWKIISATAMLTVTLLWGGNQVLGEFVAPINGGINNPPQGETEWALFSKQVQALDNYRIQGSTRHPDILLPLQTAFAMLIEYYEVNSTLDSADFHIYHFESQKSQVDSLLASIE